MKIVSIIAAAILLSLAYLAMVFVTLDFFLPFVGLADHTFESDRHYAGFLGAFWPITWVIWSGFKIATDYTLATILSLVFLTGSYPASRLVSSLQLKLYHRRRLKAERKAQEPLQDRELDAYLKSEGVYLRDYEDMETFI